MMQFFSFARCCCRLNKISREQERSALMRISPGPNNVGSERNCLIVRTGMLVWAMVIGLAVSVGLSQPIPDTILLPDSPGAAKGAK
jgi:hypothetical protein